MSASAMNSIHLEADRRETFRRARENLLHACGSETVQLSAQALQEHKLSIQHAGLKTPPPRPCEPYIPADEPFVQVRNERRCALKVGHNTVGRLPDNDIVGNDAFMSRRHCAILVHSNRSCELHDLASKNGTFLNGLKVTAPTRLNPGDEIQIGDFRMVFMDARGQTASFAQAPAVKPDHTCVLGNGSAN
ncbi:MAG TPA: FHA domain-containing protein [Gemmatales bacterium]|nr:FHA domain-containing protein [Gemmatales bacterium]HMP58598.1 FHA domain-containing protein [Gemmatales bacterium]